VNGEWSKPRELPFNSHEYSVGHPALSADESKLYFVSDMPGGNGGTDLAIFLNPIYFDLDKSFISSDARRELNKVVSIMNQYPTLEIDVRSHTDSRASDAYNMALSERRKNRPFNICWTEGLAEVA